MPKMLICCFKTSAFYKLWTKMEGQDRFSTKPFLVNTYGLVFQLFRTYYSVNNSKKAGFQATFQNWFLSLFSENKQQRTPSVNYTVHHNLCSLRGQNELPHWQFKLLLISSFSPALNAEEHTHTHSVNTVGYSHTGYGLPSSLSLFNLIPVYILCDQTFIDKYKRR